MDLFKHHPEVNHLIQKLLMEAQTILDEEFVGMYLFGSLTSGDFDQDSDIDVVVATVDEISKDIFSELQPMHERIYAGDSPWTIQLEVSYIPRRALRRYDPTNALHPHIDRGSDDFFMMQHDESWIVQRYVLRERGITLAGPAPQTLIDPVSPNDLRQAMLAILNEWVSQILEDPVQLEQRGCQSYTVLTLCRILYTLQHGTVVSKPVAARWVQETLDNQWTPLIERTWIGRHNPGLEASSEDVNGTLEFIRYALEQSRKLENLSKNKKAPNLV
jgi:predicted nucleotidyltransferase